MKRSGDAALAVILALTAPACVASRTASPSPSASTAPPMSGWCAPGEPPAVPPDFPSLPTPPASQAVAGPPATAGEARRDFVSNLTVADAVAFYREALVAAGYAVVRTDDEGFEAEVYFETGNGLGHVQIAIGSCADDFASTISIRAPTRHAPLP